MYILYVSYYIILFRINKVHSILLWYYIILYHFISYHIFIWCYINSYHIMFQCYFVVFYVMLYHLMLYQFILLYPIIHTRSILLDSSRVTSKSPLWVDGDPRGLSNNMEEPVETWKAPAMKGAAAQWWPLAVRLGAVKMFEVGGKPSWFMIVQSSCSLLRFLRLSVGMSHIL